MKHGSLFSGIGGFDLAAEWMGWENVFHCEWNDFGKQILKYYWPNAKSYDDITKTDFTIHRGSIDILTGGFPCQPYSTAGKRKGKEDERHLWPEMLRAIREIQPRWVVGENVLGLVNWNGGLVFDEVQTDLETEGYEVFPYILPACSVNAPHRRDRVWFVAYRNISSEGSPRTSGKAQSNRSENNDVKDGRGTTSEFSIGHGHVYGIDTNSQSESSRGELFEQSGKREFGGQDSIIDVTDSNSRRQSSKEHRKEESGRIAKTSIPDNWKNFPTQSPICDGNDGISSRLDGITFPKWRNESIKGGGNAIVPQVAFNIFKAIEQYK